MIGIGNIHFDMQRARLRIDGIGCSRDLSFKNAVGNIAGGDLRRRIDFYIPRRALRHIDKNADGIILHHAIKRRRVGRASGSHQIADIDAALGDRAVIRSRPV